MSSSKQVNRKLVMFSFVTLVPVLLRCNIYRWRPCHCKSKLTNRDKEHCKLNHSLTSVWVMLLCKDVLKKKIVDWRTVTNNTVSKMLNMNTCYRTIIILLSFVKPFILATQKIYKSKLNKRQSAYRVLINMNQKNAKIRNKP